MKFPSFEMERMQSVWEHKVKYDLSESGVEPLTLEEAARDTGRRVGAHLARRGDPSVYVSSFWWSALEGARETATTVRRAYVFASSPPRHALIAEARRSGLWALHPNRAYVTEELVRDAHAGDLWIQAWTVNEVVEIARFAALGVDGIMSDFPERIPKV